jgi:hypothetical protein
MMNWRRRDRFYRNELSQRMLWTSELDLAWAPEVQLNSTGVPAHEISDDVTLRVSGFRPGTIHPDNGSHDTKNVANILYYYVNVPFCCKSADILIVFLACFSYFERIKVGL